MRNEYNGYLYVESKLHWSIVNSLEEMTDVTVDGDQCSPHPPRIALSCTRIPEIQKQVSSMAPGQPAVR